MLFVWLLVFIVSIVVLLKSSDFFIDYSKILGRKFGISDILIGITIVAIGTSLPELVTSIIANINGQSEIVLSNVVGSNIANIMLVFGVGVIILKKIEIHKSMFIDSIILIIMTMLLFLFSNDFVIKFYEASIFVLLFVLYLIYLIKTKAKAVAEEVDEVEIEDEKVSVLKIVIILLLSGFGIYISSEFVIRAVVNISTITGIGKDIIATTAIAIGTSLPELVVSIVSAKKGEHDILIGNVVGSNMFNILSVVGISGLIGPLKVTPALMNLAFPVLIVSTLYIVIAIIKKKAFFIEGIILVLGYVVFSLKLFNVI